MHVCTIGEWVINLRSTSPRKPARIIALHVNSMYVVNGRTEIMYINYVNRLLLIIQVWTAEKISKFVSISMLGLPFKSVLEDGVHMFINALNQTWRCLVYILHVNK